MANFATLWKNHVGRGYVCDRATFGNQCAMRMGQSLEASGISLVGRGLKRCKDYSPKFKSHSPGHVRSAQDLANVFYHTPTLLGAGVKRQIFTGPIDDNINSFKQKRGMVFIMNGWGNIDHIDLWDGLLMQFRGANNSLDYR